MIAILRIKGRTDLSKDIDETLKRLRIHRKLYCTIIDKSNKVQFGMLRKVKDCVAYGEISDELLKKMIEKRGETLNGKKISSKEIGTAVEGIKKGDWKIKKFFRLHPPIGGFRKSTKQIYPKGILGENKEIDKLLERML